MSTPALHDAHVHLAFVDGALQLARDAATQGTLLFSCTVTPQEYAAHLADAGAWTDTRGEGLLGRTVFVGAGLHPWWVRPDRYRDDLAALELAIARQAAEKPGRSDRDVQSGRLDRPDLPVRCDRIDRSDQPARSRKPAPLLIGEVGLDFGERHVSTRAEQLEVFSRVCELAAVQACSEGQVAPAMNKQKHDPQPITSGLPEDAAHQTPPAKNCTADVQHRPANSVDRPVLSIHAVRSATAVLDVLERTGCLDRNAQGRTRCACILHWFSGNGDELHRAARAGCFFSVGPRMVATRRGAAYARQIPLGQLLLETDDPPGQSVVWPYARIRAGLQEAFDAIAEAKGFSTVETREGLAAAIDRNTRNLMMG